MRFSWNLNSHWSLNTLINEKNRLTSTAYKENYLADLANYGVHQVHWRHSSGYSIWLSLLDCLLQMAETLWVNCIFNRHLSHGILRFIQCTWPLVVFAVFWLMLSLVFLVHVRCLTSLSFTSAILQSFREMFFLALFKTVPPL